MCHSLMNQNKTVSTSYSIAKNIYFEDANFVHTFSISRLIRFSLRNQICIIQGVYLTYQQVNSFYASDMCYNDVSHGPFISSVMLQTKILIHMLNKRSYSFSERVDNKIIENIKQNLCYAALNFTMKR
jgi:hypothetical protein